MDNASTTRNISSDTLQCHTWITQYINVSRKDVSLEEINSVLVIRLLGGITFVSLLAVVGLIGNIHVVYIFGWKFPKSSDYKVFVIWLGLIDIVTMSIYAPLLVHYLFKPLTYDSELLCKTFRFLQYLCAISSNCALVVIAINRCMKILLPLRPPMTPRTAKINSGISFLVAVFLSWPGVALFSIVDAPSGIQGFQGKRCLVHVDDFSKFKIFSGSNIIFFIAVLILLILSYSLIGWRIKHRMEHSRITSESNRFPIHLPSTTSSTFCEQRSTSHSSNRIFPQTKRRKNSNARNQQKRLNKSSSTGTLFLISVVYILAALPHHILSILFFVVPNFDCNLSLTESLFFYVFIWSYFLNSVANPFIYGFRDRRFRKKLLLLYKKLCY